MGYSTPVQGDPDTYLSLLSAAQIETLRHVFEHKNSKEIARIMGVSPHTVDERVRRSLKKLNTSHRIEAHTLPASKDRKHSGEGKRWAASRGSGGGLIFKKKITSTIKK